MSLKGDAHGIVHLDCGGTHSCYCYTKDYVGKEPSGYMSGTTQPSPYRLRSGEGALTLTSPGKKCQNQAMKSTLFPEREIWYSVIDRAVWQNDDIALYTVE